MRHSQRDGDDKGIPIRHVVVTPGDIGRKLVDRILDPAEFYDTKVWYYNIAQD